MVSRRLNPEKPIVKELVALIPLEESISLSCYHGEGGGNGLVVQMQVTCEADYKHCNSIKIP